MSSARRQTAAPPQSLQSWSPIHWFSQTFTGRLEAVTIIWSGSLDVDTCQRTSGVWR